MQGAPVAAPGAAAPPRRRGRRSGGAAAPRAVIGGRARSPSRTRTPRHTPLSFASGLVSRVVGAPTEASADEAAAGDAPSEAPQAVALASEALAAPEEPPSRARRLARLVTRVRRAASPRALRRRVDSWRGAAADAPLAPPAPPDAPPGGDAAVLPKPAEGGPSRRRPPVDIRRFLRPTSSADLAVVRKMASLSAFAYFIPSVTERSLYKSHRLKLVTTSLERRASAARPALDRARLAEAILAAPAAPPYAPALLRAAPPPQQAARAGAALLPAAARDSAAVPSGLLRYLPADAVDVMLTGRREDGGGAGTRAATLAEAERSSEAAAAAAASAADAESEAAAERALSAAVQNILTLATAEADAADAAAARAGGGMRSLLWPLRQRPVLSAAVRASARVARSVARPAAAAATPLVSTASTYVTTLAAAAAPLAVAAASGSSAAAAALAAAAGPLAATAATGSSVAAQALGGIIDPLAATAVAGGSLAGSTLASITGAVAAAAAAAATRVRGPRGRDAAGADAALVAGGGTTALAAPPVAARPGRAFCPCEWFVGDDERAATRYFVIQGSDSAASWRSNLAFDPVTFEHPALGAKVHRGVYEAACALYDALAPMINEHVAKHGIRKARLVFTGHSLGGSLATLMVLMLRYRRPELSDALLPVYTVGAPAVFCDDCCAECLVKRASARASRLARAHAGGAPAPAPGRDACCRGVLGALGLPRDHVRNVMMHLDIVPRAFACDYRLVQAMLRRIGGSFREHPGLRGPDNITLYTPAGVTLVLQPSEAAAAQHAMLPPGSGLYTIDDPAEPFWTAVSVPWALGGNGGGSGSDETLEGEGVAEEAAVPDARAALSALLNSPHPLDILADVAAYGPQGTVSQYHNPWNYVRALVNEQRRRKQWRKPVEAGVGLGWRLANDATARVAGVAAAAGARLGLGGWREAAGAAQAAADKEEEGEAPVDAIEADDAEVFLL